LVFERFRGFDRGLRKLDEKFRQFDATLRRTRQSFFGQMSELFQRTTIDESLWDDLEALLIQADVGVETTETLLDRLKSRAKKERITEPPKLYLVLQEELRVLLGESREVALYPSEGLGVIMVVGVNGVGKTTTIAKLARYWNKQGRKVMLAAGDTFRAAAIDQLKIWGERAGIPVIAHQPGADPGSVVFDALTAAKARGADLLVIDTAGRLHTKFNLMEEMKKIRRVVEKQGPERLTTLLVLDATTGQNALVQAKQFQKAVPIDGLVVAKLDGTAKGGMVFAIANELNIPITFIGTGEKIDDIAEFDADRFVEALLSAPEEEDAG
jgi:fused signal recognition particle receptor